MKRYNIDADTCEVYECYNGEYVKYEDSASYNAALEAKCADLEQQLASMTAERDSESRWAKQYHDEAVALRNRLAMALDTIQMYKQEIFYE